MSYALCSNYKMSSSFPESHSCGSTASFKSISREALFISSIEFEFK